MMLDMTDLGSRAVQIKPDGRSVGCEDVLPGCVG